MLSNEPRFTASHLRAQPRNEKQSEKQETNRVFREKKGGRGREGGKKNCPAADLHLQGAG